MTDTDAPGGANPPARPVLRPSAVHVRVRGPRPSDPDWRLRGTGPGGAGHAHLWTDGAFADLLLDAAGYTPPDEPDGEHDLAVFVSGDGGGGVILRLIPKHELLAEQDATDRATRAALTAAGDLDRQRALADPVRARRVIVLHDDGVAMGRVGPLLLDLEARGITALSRIRIDPDDPGSVLAALEIVRDHVTWYCPDLVVIACARERRGLPVRGLAAPDVLAEIAHLPVPVVTLPGPRGGLIDAVAWRPIAAVDDFDVFMLALLAQELRLAEVERLQAIGDLLTALGAPDAAA
jgi:hypothetical protein